MKDRKRQAVVAALALVIGLCIRQGAAETERVMLPVERRTVVIDPGHGGWDPGKTAAGSADEKEINLAIAGYLQQYLEQGGAEVILTRQADTALGGSKGADMAERKAIADGAGVDLLVSIHQNAFTTSAAQGAQVFYHGESPEGKAAAECIQEALRQVDGENKRQVKANATYYILRQTKAPAALVECGFLSNPAEAAKLNTEAYRQEIAWAIYCGIATYFGEEMG